MTALLDDAEERFDRAFAGALQDGHVPEEWVFVGSVIDAEGESVVVCMTSSGLRTHRSLGLLAFADEVERRRIGNP